MIFIILVGISIGAYIFYTTLRKNSLEASIHLVTYEWDVRVIDWEHECVELNITLFNSGDGDGKFGLEVNLYDGQENFGSELWEIKLPAKHQETFTKIIHYELLFNKHHANAIEIVCGIYGDDQCLKKLYFREFSSK